MSNVKTIADIAATVKEVKTSTRTLVKFSNAIKSHLDLIQNDPKFAERAQKSLGQVFTSATSGKDRVTPGMIKTLAHNSLAKLQSYNDDIAIDRHSVKGVKSDSAMIRNGGAVVTAGVVKALKAAAEEFIKLYTDFKSDASIVGQGKDSVLTLDVTESTVEAIQA